MFAKQLSCQPPLQPFRHNPFFIFVPINCFIQTFTKILLFPSLTLLPMFQQISGTQLAAVLGGNPCIGFTFRDLKGKPTLSSVQCIILFQHCILSPVLSSGSHRQRQAEGGVFWVLPEAPKSLSCILILFLQILIVLKDVGKCLEISACTWGRSSVN